MAESPLDPILDVPPPLADSDLDLALDALVEGEAAPEEVDAWAPSDLASAEWAARRLARAQRQLDEFDEQYEQWLGQLRAWYLRVAARPSAEVVFMEHRLASFALAERERTGRATVDLPSGAIRTTRHQAKAVVTNEKELIEWLPTALSRSEVAAVIKQPEPSVLVSELRKRVTVVTDGETYRVMTEHGELVPGVEAEPPHVTASVRVDPR